MMTHVRRFALSLIATMAAMVFASGTLNAKGFQFANAKTGKCVTIAGGTLADNNVTAVQFDCDADPSRQWLMNKAGGSSTYQLKNVKTGKCLTIAGGSSTDNNVRALQFDCDSDPSRSWKFIASSAGFQIKNVQTGKCLTIAGGTLSDNNRELVQYDCDSDASRSWIIKGPPSSSSPTPPPASTYQTSAWSAWIPSRADLAQGIQYRYAWGWDPSNPTYIDAKFQVRSLRRPDPWTGRLRSLDCERNMIESDGAAIDKLMPNETREPATFKTKNCGTASKPFFRPDVTTSSFL